MIIKIFNANEYLGIISTGFDIKIVSDLKKGIQTCYFKVPYNTNIPINPEQNIEIDNYAYTVKEMNMYDNYYEVYCQPNLDGLFTKQLEPVSGYTYSFDSIMNMILEGTGWIMHANDFIYGSHSIYLYQMTVQEALDNVKTLYNCDFFFDTKNKIIEVWNVRGDKTSIFTITPANIIDCKITSNTYDLITCLIPIGKDGITIGQSNNGCLYVENYEYTNKKIFGYYINDKITDADDLLTVAKYKIADCGKPATTYKIYLSKLEETNLNVGDVIQIIDTIRNKTTFQRIQKIVRFVDKPEKSYLEAGRLSIPFDDIFKNFKTGQNIINGDKSFNITTLFKNYDGINASYDKLEARVKKLEGKVK